MIGIDNWGGLKSEIVDEDRDIGILRRALFLGYFIFSFYLILL